MPTNVANSIGTQRQFTAQPKSTYQMNLRDINAGAGMSGSDDYNASALVRALGVLGDTITNEASHLENRREKEQLSIAERAINATSGEDLEKLKAIEILGRYGNYDRADNPYAVAAIEKARGKALAFKARSEFETENPNLTNFKDSAEVVKAYEEHQKKVRDDLASNADNSIAFDQGFYESHPSDVLTVADKYRKAKSEQLKNASIGTSMATAGQIATDSMYKTHDETITSVTELANTVRLSQWTDEEKRSFWDKAVLQIAQSSGDGALLDKVKGVVIYNDGQRDYTIGDQISFADKYKVAGSRANTMRTADVETFLDKASKYTSVQDLRDAFEVLAKDPSKRTLFEAVVPHKAYLETQITKAEAIKAKANVYQQAEQGKQLAIKTSFDRQTAAWLSDRGTDSAGKPVGNVVINYLDEHGVQKSRQATQEELAPLLQNKIIQIAGDKNLSDEDKIKTTLKLLNYPDTKFYAKNWGEQAVAQLDTLDPKSLEGSLDEDGNYKLPSRLGELLKAREIGKSQFDVTFGSTVAGKIDAIATLQDYYGYNGGVNAYVNSRERLDDKQLQGTYRTTLDRESFVLDKMETPYGTEDVSMLGNGYELERAKEQARILMSCGLSKEEAKAKAVDAMRQNNYSYHGALIPKSVFTGMNTQYAYEGIDYWVADYKEGAGLLPSNPVTVEWSHGDNKLVIKSGAERPKYYSLDDLRNQYDYVYENYADKGNVQAAGKSSTNFSVFGDVGDDTTLADHMSSEY